MSVNKAVYEVTFRDRTTGREWQEGLPYIAWDEEDAERQMLMVTIGGEEHETLESMRRAFHEATAGNEAYRVQRALGWCVPTDGSLPYKKEAQPN
jgi:hypothetical protein